MKTRIRSPPTSPKARPVRLRLCHPLQEAGPGGLPDRAGQRRRSHRLQAGQQGGQRAGHQGHRRLHAVPGRPLWQRRSIYDGDYEPIAGADLHPFGFGLTFIDHLTHNLYFGNMQQWSDYYERLFNFREIRYFDIKGLKTGLVSKAMTAPDGIVRIPLNESSDPKSQINEYLDAYKGEGIQHIACFTENIYETVEAMRAQGVDFSTRRKPIST
jgi:4-hydroxyphenylpyruvate dioxygenase-like putative hemolysin